MRRKHQASVSCYGWQFPLAISHLQRNRPKKVANAAVEIEIYITEPADIPYSSDPKKSAGPNKRAGWDFDKD